MMIRTICLGLVVASAVVLGGCKHSTSQRVSSSPAVVSATAVPCCPTPTCPTPGCPPTSGAVVGPPTTIPPPPGAVIR